MSESNTCPKCAGRKRPVRNVLPKLEPGTQANAVACPGCGANFEVKNGKLTGVELPRQIAGGAQ